MRIDLKNISFEEKDGKHRCPDCSDVLVYDSQDLPENVVVIKYCSNRKCSYRTEVAYPLHKKQPASLNSSQGQ